MTPVVKWDFIFLGRSFDEMSHSRDKKGRVERSDAAENRRRILETAQRLFDLHGVDQVSMNQIAIEAQIGAGPLYRRYRNKSDLCMDLIENSMDECFDCVEKHLRRRHDDPADKRLKDILKIFLRFRDKKIELLAGVEDGTFDLRTNTITQTPVYNKMHEIIVGLFNEMTGNEQAEANNVFRADMLIYAMIKGDSYLFQRDYRGYSPDSFLEQLCLTFFPEK